MNISLAHCQQVAETAARLGAAVLESWRGRFTAREKGRADLVSEADHASQQMISSYLNQHFPDFAFLGEEDPDARTGKNFRKDVPLWIVDPLDGTSNYVHDVPAYCVSIGLMLEGELVVGVVYDPRLNEMYSAARGRGATLNGSPIRVSATKSIGQAMLSTGFPPDVDKQDRNVHWWRIFSMKAQSLRRTGSTALNMAYVAAGRFDAYWALDNYAWDVAAGIVLVREAGGMVTCLDGSPCDVFRPDLLAANADVHADMLQIIQSQR